ncbi:MAG: GTP 3',8-cyclase MoaA [Candidatus Thorarchaeota archaeon]|nr:MAG: GTP 3',8-cyclase MoaA [Candidatus Thorarchaeota archaeon]
MVDMQAKGTAEDSAKQFEPLMDDYGRPINYLRLSLTQRCNHSCLFCHREGEYEPGSEMTIQEIERLVQLAARHGIKRVKLTGGEPLLRDDIIDIVKLLSPLVDDLSLTTNGSLLQDLAPDLKAAGLDRINVSLHTLREETHGRVTGSKDLDRVKKGIKKCIEVGLTPVKINMTLLSGFNENEVESMIDFAGEVGATLQLIELQEFSGDTESYTNLWVDLNPIEKHLDKVSIKVEQRSLHGRRLYTVPTEKGLVRIEVVRPMNNPSFCGQCTRLRVTSDGKLKPCLRRNDNLVNTREYQDISEAETKLLDALLKAVRLREPFWNEEDKT